MRAFVVKRISKASLERLNILGYTVIIRGGSIRPDRQVRKGTK